MVIFLAVMTRVQARLAVNVVAKASRAETLVFQEIKAVQNRQATLVGVERMEVSW